MSDSMKYDFPAIEGAVSTVQGQVSNIQGLLEQGQQSVAKLAALWEGSGSDSMRQAQQQWDTNATDLNAKLKTLADRVGEASSNMQSTEGGVASMFG